MHFESVYRTHFAGVWRTVRRLGIPEKDALDVTQEVFLVALRRLHEFEGRSSEKTWLIGIAFRVVANRLRLASFRNEFLTRNGDDPRSAVPHQGPDQDLVRQLECALGALPLDQRAVFTMFEMEQLTGEEIATALNIPIGTVRSRLRMARQSFRKAVEAQMLEPIYLQVAGAEQ